MNLANLSCTCYKLRALHRARRLDLRKDAAWTWHFLWMWKVTPGKSAIMAVSHTNYRLLGTVYWCNLIRRKRQWTLYFSLLLFFSLAYIHIPTMHSGLIYYISLNSCDPLVCTHLWLRAHLTYIHTHVWLYTDDIVERLRRRHALSVQMALHTGPCVLALSPHSCTF